MTAPTPFGYDHSTGPDLSEMWARAAADSAAERASEPEQCCRVLGTSPVGGQGFVNGRPGAVRDDGQQEWLCVWPASRVDPDGVRVCGAHAPLTWGGGSTLLPRDERSGQ